MFVLRLRVGLLGVLATISGCVGAATPDADSDHDPSGEDVASSLYADTLADRTILPPPWRPLTRAEREKFVPVPSAIPVLLFHEICEAACPETETYGMTQLEFARTLAMLEHAGYETISASDYVRFLHGDLSALPANPILLTFDDGRLDAYRGADGPLRVAKARATMFIITDRAEQNLPGFMHWSEIAAAQGSARWDIQLHADNGHVLIPTGPSTTGPFYANRRYDAKVYAKNADHLEPMVDWRARVRADVDHGNALLKSHVFGYEPLTMAVPFGNYGQISSNDPTLAADFSRFLSMRFDAFLTQPIGRPDFSTPTSSHEHYRYTIKLATTADTIYDWLSTTAKKRSFHALTP